MLELFANTGVQLLCFPLGDRARGARTGLRWQTCRIPEGDRSSRRLDFIQWRLQGNRLFLAVDTSCGDTRAGHFASVDVKDLSTYSLSKIIYQPEKQSGDQVLDVGKCEFRIRATGAGEAKAVHLVIDFGNSRTGALLLEVSDQVGAEPEMFPLELINRWQLDAWDERGVLDHRRGCRWFASRTHWCAPPYRMPDKKTTTEYRQVKVPGRVYGERVMDEPYQVEVPGRLFEDWSMVRMGPEVEDVVFRAIRGGLRTGVSSPKRYLWAHDSSWLEGDDWYMADPCDDFNNNDGTRVARLQGPLLRFLFEEDRDQLLLETGAPSREELLARSIDLPRHAPQTLMIVALYEILCQAYGQINSIGYREKTGRSASVRYLASLTLTYPSGSIADERERFEKQAKKAALIFHMTIGRNQKAPPQVTLGLDEASAVHLAYLWSEVRSLDSKAALWFNLAGREVVQSATPAAAPRAPRAPRPGEPLPPPPPPPRASSRALRVACLDIGGGTTDLMIARYLFDAPGGVENEIRGEIIHRDGIPVAGDRLVKRLLERVIVPRFAQVAGLDKEQTQFLFGPDVPDTRRYRSERIKWVNHLFVPLAHAYLGNAALDRPDLPINHTDGTLVESEFLDRLQKIIDEKYGLGRFSVHRDLELHYEKEVFDRLVNEVFYELFYSFSKRIVEHKADVVLLAGQPSRLAEVQKLLRLFVPLPPSRIIPMDGYHAGTWYPYQDAEGRFPGVIVDPKSAVVVGAAIHFLTMNGMLPQFRFKMNDGSHKKPTYYWGVMTDEISGIPESRVLFGPKDPPGKMCKLPLETNHLLLGRRIDDQETSCAAPIYLLKLEKGGRLGRSEVSATLRKGKHPRTEEEVIDLIEVSGEVAGEPAALYDPATKTGNVRWDWRTIADERFFLDSGGLDNIDFTLFRPA